MTTTTDCLNAAKKVYEAAKLVTTREEHVNLWDWKVEVLNTVNKALETGAFTGEARQELKDAQTLCVEAERVAGKQAAKTYA